LVAELIGLGAQVECVADRSRGEQVEGQLLLAGIVGRRAGGLGAAELIFELTAQVAAAIEPVQRQLRLQLEVADVRLAADDLRRPDFIGRLIDEGRAFGAKRVVPPPEDAGVRAAFLPPLAPAERAGQIDIRRQLARPVLQVRTNRPMLGGSLSRNSSSGRLMS
jgi:hypothetical protein